MPIFFFARLQQKVLACYQHGRHQEKDAGHEGFPGFGFCLDQLHCPAISKVEKDNACDKMDACEEAMKTAKVVTLNIQKRPKSFTAQVRAQKGEDEVAELDAKALYNKKQDYL